MEKEVPLLFGNTFCPKCGKGHIQDAMHIDIPYYKCYNCDFIGFIIEGERGLGMSEYHNKKMIEILKNLEVG